MITKENFDYLVMRLPVWNNYLEWSANFVSDYNCGYEVEPSSKEVFLALLMKKHQMIC